jgi:uncharacterized protein YjbI with pentapeptide repeats
VNGVQVPLIKKNITWNKLANNNFVTETHYENLSVNNLSLKEIKASNVIVDCGIFNHINLSGSKLEKIKLNDIKMSECNFSNLDAFESFWLRIEISDSKLTGLKLNSSTLEDIFIQNSNSQFLQMRFSKAVRLYCESCNLRGSDFENTDLSGCKFINCDLSEAEFSGCTLKGADLRGSNLEKIKIGVKEIKGAIVNTSQALFLSGLLGIDIRD